MPAGNVGTIEETGTTSHTATTGCYHLCHANSQVLLPRELLFLIVVAGKVNKDPGSRHDPSVVNRHAFRAVAFGVLKRRDAFEAAHGIRVSHVVKQKWRCFMSDKY